MTNPQRKTIGLFYGSSTCYTEMAGEKIRQHIGEQHLDFFNIATQPIIEAQFYDYLIFGIPTWDYGELQEDWEDIWPELEELNLTGKKVALYGLGDQIGYPEWFLDALGYLHAQLSKRGATFYGYWPNTDYSFEQSQGLTPDGTHFLGLALDDENQSHLSAERISRWCDQLMIDWNLLR